MEKVSIDPLYEDSDSAHTPYAEVSNLVFSGHAFHLPLTHDESMLLVNHCSTEVILFIDCEAESGLNLKLVQVACRGYDFILHVDVCGDAILALFESPVPKFGINISNDLQWLSDFGCDVSTLHDLKPLLLDVGLNFGSLSDFMLACFGLKMHAMHWSYNYAMPLTLKAINYCRVDVLCLLRLYDHISSLKFSRLLSLPDLGKKFDVLVCGHKYCNNLGNSYSGFCSIKCRQLDCVLMMAVDHICVGSNKSLPKLQAFRLTCLSLLDICDSSDAVLIEDLVVKADLLITAKTNAILSNGGSLILAPSTSHFLEGFGVSLDERSSSVSDAITITPVPDVITPSPVSVRNICCLRSGCTKRPSVGPFCSEFCQSVAAHIASSGNVRFGSNRRNANIVLAINNIMSVHGELQGTALVNADLYICACKVELTRRGFII